MSDAKRTEGEPHDRLTRITIPMTEAMEAHPEYGDDIKCIVFLDDGKRGGLQIFNYESDTDALVDLFMHLRAIFEANGKTLMFAPINKG
jgi:hypothetical protein